MLDLNPKFHNNHNKHANYKNKYNNGSNGVQFRLETMDEDSGVCSPPLWRSMSPPDSPVRFPNPRSLSPASRAQAIARGQREMMEMVENMPETSYELSLKDIVEQRREFTDASVDETQSVEDGERRLISNRSNGGQQSQRRRKYKKQESSKRMIAKTGSMNHSTNNNNNKGLLINMFFPFSIGSKKMKVNSFNGVKSPKPELLEKSGGGGDGGGGGGDRREWWKKFKESGYSDSSGITSSESTGRSGSSGSSGSSAAGSLRNNSDRRDNGCTHGCWSLFPYRKKKS